jgi:hypothetical protein
MEHLKHLVIGAVAVCAVAGATIIPTAGAAPARPCTKMPPGTTNCVLVPFAVWYCRGLMQPEQVVLLHPASPGPACARGVAWYERYGLG